jgi:hypothetical protein
MKMEYCFIELFFVNTVTCILVATQRRGKYSPAKRMRATEGRPLLGNGQVNTPP